MRTLLAIVLVIGTAIIPTPTPSPQIIRLEIPAAADSASIVYHAGYAVMYDTAHKQAAWVAYELTAGETEPVAERANTFTSDPLLPACVATNADYAKSGYDRGHLAPAGDMGWSAAAMAESFYLSNVSPQLPAFNRGIWKRLEEQVRPWARENGAVYVVTGPVFGDSIGTIGPHHIPIPTYFYKVILDYRGPDHKGIGFVMANAASSQPLQAFAVSIDSVERMTGLDLFPRLPDGEEAILEDSLNTGLWHWQ